MLTCIPIIGGSQGYCRGVASADFIRFLPVSLSSRWWTDHFRHGRWFRSGGKELEERTLSLGWLDIYYRKGNNFEYRDIGRTFAVPACELRGVAFFWDMLKFGRDASRVCGEA